MKKFIEYFIHKHLLANVIFFGVILLAIATWFRIGKEEMPEFASNWVRVSTSYPGAPAEDVELFITKPIEYELKSVVGIEEVTSTSSVGVSSFRIVIDEFQPDKDQVLQDIKDAVLRVNYPSEVRDLPRIRQFKSSEKAILDIGIYHKEHRMLDTKSRSELQKYVLAFENQLLSLKEISSVEKNDYLKPELQILVDPQKNKKLQISLTEIKNQIQENNIRVPIGSLEDKGESKITALNELETVESFSDLALRGNYEGTPIKLNQLAHVQDGFEKRTSIFKINGHEGVFLNIRKSISTDILSAQKAVMSLINKYKKSNKNSPIGIVTMDDESFDVKNRINIISSNGILGFILIILILFIFMDLKSSFWVAMGIPFSMATTLIFSNLIGYTVNNMTLAGIIIVLGIVVDDAIIIAENISRHSKGNDKLSASIIGAYEVFKPILASIVTTCIAFLPLMFFEGFFGKLVAYIPLVVIFMLLGSLFESLFILPSHLASDNKLLEHSKFKKKNENWFEKYEVKYENFLLKVFNHRIAAISAFTVLLLISGIIFSKKMKFVMFPREESKEIIIKVKAKSGTFRKETAKLIQPIEDMFARDTQNIVGVRSSIAKSRRGGEVNENEASILAELIPADERSQSLNKLMENWKEKTKNLPGIESVKFLKGRWGHDSGSPIEVQILENNDSNRSKIANIINSALKDKGYISESEIEKPLEKNEYLFHIKQKELIKLNVPASNVTTALRAFVEGAILYTINKGDEEIDVRLSVPDSAKKNIKDLLDLEVENKQGYLVKLSKVVKLKEQVRPVNISRTDYKRSTMIYADLKEDSETTPLQVANMLEEDVFPAVLDQYPTSILRFRGEIKDSRESQGQFTQSILMVVMAIYLILVIMLNSLSKPLYIMLIVPFGLSGVIYVLYLHGMYIYGFFATIGALGMIGVVINDAIVMIDKVETSFKDNAPTLSTIASVASTRLRPILLTTITTVAGILPTAYGIAGYDSMLAEMMLTMGWGLAYGTLITLILIPSLYTFTIKKS